MSEIEIDKYEIINSYYEYLKNRNINSEWEDFSLEAVNQIFEQELADNILEDIKKINSFDRNILSRYYRMLIEFFQHDLAFSFSSPTKKYKIFAETSFDLSQGKPESWIGHHSPIQVSYLQNAYKKYKSIKWLNCSKLDHLFLKNFIYDEYSCSYFMILHGYHKPTASLGNAMEEAMTKGSLWKISLYRFISKPLGILLNWVLTPLLAFYLFSLSSDIANIFAYILIAWFIFMVLYKIIFLPKNYFTNKEINKSANEKLKIFLDSFRIVSEEIFNPIQLKKVMTKNETEFALFQSNEVYIIIDELINKAK